MVVISIDGFLEGVGVVGRKKVVFSADECSYDEWESPLSLKQSPWLTLLCIRYAF